MYYILHEDRAKERNLIEAFRHGCKASTRYWWAMIQKGNQIALDVGDMTGMTDHEKSKCVSSLPDDFEADPDKVE